MWFLSIWLYAVLSALREQCVVGDEAAMKQLEGIVHPLVEQERKHFIQEVSDCALHNSW